MRDRESKSEGEIERERERASVMAAGRPVGDATLMPSWWLWLIVSFVKPQKVSLSLTDVPSHHLQSPHNNTFTAYLYYRDLTTDCSV